MERAKYEASFKREATGCLVWTRAQNGVGYGVISLGGRLVYVHRHAYEERYGPIPDGLEIDHLCRNRACAEPTHMEAVTNRENVLRGAGPTAREARQTHCIHGHEFTLKNTHIRRNGSRRCRACGRIRDQKRAPTRIRYRVPARQPERRGVVMR